VNPAEPDPLASWAAGLAPQWRTPVLAAVAARDRFAAVIEQVAPGPTRDRLSELRPTIDAAVQRVADAVYRAITAEGLASGLDPDLATQELKAARRDLEAVQRGGGDTTAAEARVQAMSERHRAVHRALNLAEDGASQIDEWTVRLDTAVAHATAIALRAAQPGGLDELDRELHDVVEGLGALDQALEELGP
jgi:hypothetical protein